MTAQDDRITLSTLKPAEGSTHRRKRVGRGPGSGSGKTAGRGHKGQGSRKSGNVRPGFEGGQMPLIRRIPKRGFTNPFRVEAQVVNLKSLSTLPAEADVTPASLSGAGLVRRADRPIKILAQGDVDRAYVVRGVKASASARKKIEAAGGRLEA